ncbi:hypothetical protein TNCV_2239471 [Trichonephila clavipes]|nr:hypothetical protein TNCV_2239471 [Trichonephila clavipes]
MEYLQRLEFFVMSPDLDPIGHVWNVFGCSLLLKAQLRKPSMSSRKPRDLKMGTITTEVDKNLGIDFMKESKLTLDFDQKSLIIPDNQIKHLQKNGQAGRD